MGLEKLIIHSEVKTDGTTIMYDCRGNSALYVSGNQKYMCLLTKPLPKLQCEHMYKFSDIGFGCLFHDKKDLPIYDPRENLGDC